MSRDGSKMTGTLLIFDALDHRFVQEFMGKDPYAKADLFEKVSIEAWACGLGFEWFQA
jgi:uncharacterized protein